MKVSKPPNLPRPLSKPQTPGWIQTNFTHAQQLPDAGNCSENYSCPPFPYCYCLLNNLLVPFCLSEEDVIYL